MTVRICPWVPVRALSVRTAIRRNYSVAIVAWSVDRNDSLFLLVPIICESGVMVATGDLKSPVFGRTGSSPVSRTIPR